MTHFIHHKNYRESLFLHLFIWTKASHQILGQSYIYSSLFLERPLEKAHFKTHLSTPSTYLRQSSSPWSLLRPYYVLKGIFSKQGSQYSTAMSMYLLWVAFKGWAINTENYMKYSSTLTLCGEHDKGQNKGKQMRKTENDCSASFEVLHRAYRRTATEILWIYSINSCKAYTESKPHALLKTKLQVSNTVWFQIISKRKKSHKP